MPTYTVVLQRTRFVRSPDCRLSAQQRIKAARPQTPRFPDETEPDLMAR
jgi:hypothetical protein